MKRIETGDPEQLAYEEPLGFDGLFYGVLALFGLGLPPVLYARGHFGGSIDWARDSWLVKAMIVGLAGTWLLFTLRAFLRAFRRISFVIDRRTRTLRTRSWWPFPPGKPKSLASFHLVSTSEVAVPGPLASSIPTSRVLVALAESGGARPFGIAVGELFPMRTLAEDVARFIGFDLIDGTSVTPKVIPAVEVGRFLRGSVSGTEMPRFVDAPPAQSTLSVTNPSGGLRVEFPTGNPGCFRLLVGVVLGILAIIVYGAFHEESLNRWLAYPLFGGVAIVVLLIAASGSMPVRTVIEAGVDGLRIIRYRPFGKKQIALKPEAIRGFDAGELAFTIRWESAQWHTLALSKGEREWLARALGDALKAPVVLAPAESA